MSGQQKAKMTAEQVADLRETVMAIRQQAEDSDDPEMATHLFEAAEIAEETANVEAYWIMAGSLSEEARLRLPPPPAMPATMAELARQRAKGPYP